MRELRDMKVTRFTLYYAFRYALGRRTYAVGDVVQEIIDNWQNLSEDDRSVIQRDIVVAIEEGNAGMDMDIIQWRKILELKYDVQAN